MSDKKKEQELERKYWENLTAEDGCDMLLKIKDRKAQDQKNRTATDVPKVQQ